MKNLRINKKRLSLFAVSLVMGASSLVGISGCNKDKTYKPDVDYTATEITKVFEDDTKLDEAIDSGVAVHEGMPITEAVDELETSLHVVSVIEKDYSDLPENVSELEKLSDEDYKKAENLTKEEFDDILEQSRGFIDEDTNNSFKIMELRLRAMKMAAYKYECSKKFVQNNAYKIIENYLLYSSKAVIANETNVDGDSIGKIVIPHSPLSANDDNTVISMDVNGANYSLNTSDAGVGEGINELYNFQCADKDSLTANDYLKYIDIGKKITMLGAKIKNKSFEDNIEITNDVSYKDANARIKHVLRK